MKKQFKIGEYAEGGIIAVEIAKSRVKIACLDWNTKKEVRVCNFREEDTSSMQENLWDMTTSYYTDKVMEYIRANVKNTKPAWV